LAIDEQGIPMLINPQSMGQNHVIADDRLGFAKGEAVYCQGDPGLFWFEVIAGMIRCVRLYADGRRHLTGFHTPGDVFGAEQGCYNSSAEVVTDAAWVRRVRWGATDEDDRSLEKALASAENAILLLGHRTAASRLAAFLLDIHRRTSAARSLALPMTRSDIADHLGLTVETVSRTFAQFVRRGLLARQQPCQVDIADLEGLRTLAGDSEP
jgi:CRP/FNR family nitrogen fixation transcriptional regulator